MADIKQTTGAEVNVTDSGEDPVTIEITGASTKVVAAGKAKVEAVIKEAENPDYEGNAGRELRAKAVGLRQPALIGRQGFTTRL